METSRESQLKTYAVEELVINDEEGSYDILKVTCPNCGRFFWVTRVWGTSGLIAGRSDQPEVYIFGRSCPYSLCHKSAFVPEEYRIAKAVPHEQLKLGDTERPRRIVKRRKSKARHK